MVLKSLKWVMGRVLRLIPESVLGRILPGELRFNPASRPAPPSAPDTPIRLYIAPVNYAGQGWHWARAAELNLDGVGAVNMVAQMAADFSHPADNVVPVGFYAASKRWQREQFDAIASGFTHVLVEAEKRPFGAVLDETLTQQVNRLLSDGVKVAMVCHGSDIRLPSAHAMRHPESPFRDSMGRFASAYEKVARENRRVLDELALPIFVSTPDLVIDVPAATWLPVVVDPSLWASDASVLERRIPVVAHAPSRGPMKGSDMIDPILQGLEAEGLIEYRRVEKVPFSEMPAVYRDADVVLDQFRIADYGVAACEAMAAGRVVVANVSEHARRRVREISGMELPIIQAGPDNVGDVLRHIVAERDEARRFAARGVDLASTLHDGRIAARALGEFLAD